MAFCTKQVFHLKKDAVLWRRSTIYIVFDFGLVAGILLHIVFNSHPKNWLLTEIEYLCIGNLENSSSVEVSKLLGNAHLLHLSSSPFAFPDYLKSKAHLAVLLSCFVIFPVATKSFVASNPSANAFELMTQKDLPYKALLPLSTYWLKMTYNTSY